MQQESPTPDIAAGELLFYTSKDGKVKMEIRVEEETIWMSQQMMAELFQTTKQNISLHVANILQCGELQEEGTVKENLTVRKEGSRQVQRKVTFYNLDWIISVGYRVNSVRGTQFRRHCCIERLVSPFCTGNPAARGWHRACMLF